jgi:hypothetical protein
MYLLLGTCEFLCLNVFGYVEEVLLLFMKLLCNLSISELCSMFSFYTWCVLHVLILYMVCTFVLL